MSRDEKVMTLLSRSALSTSITELLLLPKFDNSSLSVTQRDLTCDYELMTLQHLKFTLAVGIGISPFYSICLGKKNAKAAKCLEIKKKVFLELKKKFFVKEKRRNLFMCIYIHYPYLHFIYF